MLTRHRRTIVLGLVVVAAVGLALILSAADSSAVTVEWSTASELNTAGFNLYRSESPDGPFEKINAELIPASPDPLVGGSYVFTDTDVVAGRTYYYRLEDVEAGGRASPQGTVQVTADGGSPLPYLLAALVGLAAAVFLWRK